MFGMGMGEIVLIAVVALLVLGPERLPGAAKAIGKGIRDLRQQTKDLQSTIESDTQIGDAVRELRGALRGDPETLYKKVTGDDWQGSDSPPIASSPKLPSEDEQNKSDGEIVAKNEDSSSESDVSKNDAPKSDDDAKAAPRNFVEDLIDEEFANTDDGWGQAAVNPHGSLASSDGANSDGANSDDAVSDEADSDDAISDGADSDISGPDMPVIRPAANTMARHEAIDDESEAEQDDQDDQDDQDSQAASDTANV